MRKLVYGISDDATQIGPFGANDEEDSLALEIHNGCCFLFDKQGDSGLATGPDIFNRNSFNFLLGIYDTNKNILYFCKLDT